MYIVKRTHAVINTYAWNINDVLSSIRWKNKSEDIANQTLKNKQRWRPKRQASEITIVLRCRVCTVSSRLVWHLWLLSLVIVSLLFYVLATSKVISGREISSLNGHLRSLMLVKKWFSVSRGCFLCKIQAHIERYISGQKSTGTF